MLVIDASVLVEALLVNGSARSLLAAESLQAPELIDAELLSVRRWLVLAGKLQEGDALQALATAHRLGLRRHPSRLLWMRAWELRFNLSAYDALYVALAEHLEMPLLTADAWWAGTAPPSSAPASIPAPRRGSSPCCC
jgi:predicted nucleic acid-binding protein